MRKHFNVALEEADLQTPPPADVPADPVVEETPAPAEEPADPTPIVEEPAIPATEPAPETDTAVSDKAVKEPANEPEAAPVDEVPAETPADAEVPAPAADPVEPSTAEGDEETVDPEMITMESISMEEEQILHEEASGHANAAEQHMSEIGRILEVSDALEDLAVITDGIGEASVTEVALIENAGNFAVAGSDVHPDCVIPALESFIGGRIATEGIRETAQTIWENIKRFLAEVWNHIDSFFRKMLFTVPKMKKAVAELKNKVSKASDSNKTVEAGVSFEVTMGVKNLCVDGKPVMGETALLKAYETLAAAASWVYNDYATSVVERGSIIARSIADFNPVESAMDVAAFRMQLKRTKVSIVPGGRGTDEKRFPGFATTLGAPLMGNVSLACKYFNDNQEDVSDLGALDRYRNSRCELIPTTETTKAAPGLVEFKPLSIRAMHDLLNDMDKMLDILAAYKTGPVSKAIARSKKAIADSSSAASRTFAQLREDGSSNTEASSVMNINYRAMLNFNAAYTRWAQTPMIPMMSHAISTTKMMKIIVQKSLEQYK